MPEINIKHVVSFSSEDKVHKAENILKPETYRKWKCATAGEKNASVILQFEKATKINSIDIGNESSAFVEVLVGRSSDSVSNYQVLLVASSFMSPIESRNETHNNRVRMFGPEKLSQNVKDEKWDCVQIVCTQPFNKNITYGLCFIKFHTSAEKVVEQPVVSGEKTATSKLGAFQIAYEDDEEDNSPPVGSWRERKNKFINSALTEKGSPSYAASVLASKDSPKPIQNTSKRKHDGLDKDLDKPPAKKESPAVHVNKNKIGYKDILGDKPPAKKESPAVHVNKNKIAYKDILGAKNSESNANQSQKDRVGPKNLFGLNTSNTQSSGANKPSSKKSEGPPAPVQTKAKVKAKPSFHQLMKGVVFVISGFVNPLRSEIRDKAVEMGAKYRADWDRTCTHLICAFLNTPKYLQVRKENGKIVTKDWIIECHNKRALLPWRKFMLGRYSRDSSESSESEEELVPIRQQIKTTPVMNGSSSKELSNTDNNVRKVDSNDKNSNSGKFSEGSETEDEEAIQDYMADTDIELSSGGNTEDEIRKVENKDKQKAVQSENNKNAFKALDDLFHSDDDSSLLQSRPDTSDMPLPELPNIFKSRHFFLYGDFSQSKHHSLKRYITAYNGVLEDYMSDSTKYVVSETKWDKNFDEALEENEDLIFVKPEWIFKCQENNKLVPYQPYSIIPDS